MLPHIKDTRIDVCVELSDVRASKSFDHLNEVRHFLLNGL